MGASPKAKRGKARIAGATAAILALTVIGCGDATESGRTTSLTKAQFVKKGNAICRQGRKELARLNVAAWKKYGPASNPSQAQLNNVALAMLPARVKEVRRLRSLDAPKGDEAYIDKMLTAWEEGIERGRKDPASLQGGGDEFAFARSYEMGIDYGLIDCWLS